jgi:hypothetical protein
MNRTAALLLLVGLFASACRGAPADPGEIRYRLQVYGDEVVYTTNLARSEELQVAVLNAASGSPVAGVQVAWRVTAGNATLSQPASASASTGVATTHLEGAPEGTYRVQATVERMDGRAPVLEVRVVPRPVLSDAQPAAVSAGGEVTLSGTGFVPDPAVTAVYFDNVRGRVLSASATTLRVEVPQCLPARTAQVRVGLGAVSSEARTVAVSATGGTLLQLQPGGVRTFTDPGQLACLRIPGDTPSAAWVMVVHSGIGTPAPPHRFELRGLAPSAPLATIAEPGSPSAPPLAEAWEAALRRRERLLGPAVLPPDGERTLGAMSAALPVVGSRRDFNVLTRDQSFQKVTAEARNVTDRAVMYVDVEALTELVDEDLAFFGRLFDDPIHPTMVQVFGEASDLDGNQRIIILFTPQVNALTPRGSSSFITGFFYGCDLVSRSRCSGTNQGEVFYALVPDPGARWSDARSRMAVRAAVPPVLAHEFQHMIHFARRGFSSDALWLSEGLAHTAEDVVADVLQARGETALASAFRSGNADRARHFLSNTAGTALLDDEVPGTIGQRGGAWLFMKYVRLHHGGNDLLRRLTGSTRSSVANVVQETGTSWQDLTTRFGVALWASDSPDMAGPLEPRYTFPGFSVRGAVSPIPGTFPLRPTAMPWRENGVAGNLTAAGHAYFSLIAPSTGSIPPLNFVLAGRRGAQPEPGVSLSVIRVR